MNFAIITPSYAPDFERCRLLCQTVDQFVDPEVKHYLLVDACDRGLFSSLQNERTEMFSIEEILPWWIRRTIFSRKVWLSFKTLPLRGWIIQQLAKLSVAEFVEADGYIFVDSDVFFIRPFSPKTFVRDNKFRLFRVPGGAQLPSHFRWHQTAAKLLGLPVRDYFGSTYIGNLITWRRNHLKQMYEHIGKVSGTSWQLAVARQWHLSEYILYGIFVEHILCETAEHYYDEEPVCHISWDYEIDTQERLDHFFSEVKPEHVAIMVSSKQHVPASRYEHVAGNFV
ncbi:MAG: DUF6492 family protein [Gemmataceae bacterium]